eukprot:TRINITY_DN612_c0_g1_i9.p1 TRINITY_DN612_c0_g1~~TRINITY_DN612_c0_g1_i9.p1  ORF type:complete len:138 (+),score=9.06 TRINITY_DN612_c0_g1_i9:220-633(+)
MDRTVPHGQDGREEGRQDPLLRLAEQGDARIVLRCRLPPCQPLLIELNMLADTWTPDKDRPPVRKFLADHFLDKRNRHLVFTTHHPITALLNESLSQRDAVTVDLPQVFNVKELKTLDNSRSSDVSKCYAAFIPLVI